MKCALSWYCHCWQVSKPRAVPKQKGRRDVPYRHDFRGSSLLALESDSQPPKINNQKLNRGRPEALPQEATEATHTGEKNNLVVREKQFCGSGGNECPSGSLWVPEV